MPKKMKSPAAVAAEARARLSAMADPEKALQLQKYFKETVRSFGVGSPQVRELARELHEATRKDWSVRDAVSLCDRLFPQPELEAKSVAALVLLRYQKDFSPALFQKTHGWLKANYLDNWASVDTFCPQALGILLLRHPRLLAAIEKWATHPNRWVRRASLVAFLKLVDKEEYLDAAYRMAARHFASGDDLVQKAAGWLLREAGKRDMRRLEKFLLANGPSIPRTTLRYAIERFPEKKRRELLLRTRAK
ncbi:MAG TPA: DNA alkylation repair protein [Acidobacteriota bacterium]